MSLPSTFKVTIAAALAVAMLAVGAAVVTAGAANPPTTYYACLLNGSLSQVGTTSPTCQSKGATVISWNSVGPQGLPGADGKSVLNGPTPPSTATGSTGDFYLDTTTYVIYGPAVRMCVRPLACGTHWGNGTRLIGPAGPPGQGVAYQTSTAAAEVPNGNLAELLILKPPTGADFTVQSKMVLTGPNSSQNWDCELMAANPTSAPVQLDYSDVGTNVGFIPLTLQGVVSLAPGGSIWVQCETNSQENDEVDNLQILATQVSGFQVLPPVFVP
jgi:hypothetical protein